jgi:hypothetical protein
MTQNKQTADEVRWATAMADILGVALERPPEKQEEPRPDVLLTLADGRRVAVEVVEAMDQALREGYAGTLRRVVYQVTDGMKARGLAGNVGLGVSAAFVATLAELSGKAQQALSARIVELAAQAVSTPPPPGKHGWIFQDASPDVQPIGNALHYSGELSSRDIEGFKWIVVNPWHEPIVLTGTYGETPAPALIQAAIDKKAARRPRYDVSNADAFWLLVVGSIGSPVAIPMNVAEQHSFTSPFDRTSFLDCWEQKCTWLKTDLI